MLGGFASGSDATALDATVRSYPQTFPFLLVAITAVVAVVAVMRFVQHGTPPQGQQARLKSPVRGGEIRLLVLAAIAAGGLGAFEVGLALRSRDLTITPEMLGLMFAGCMVVMLIVQAIAFSPLVKPATTRWLVAPSFAGMGLGLALISIATKSNSLLAATALVAATGGLLTPVLAYWVSRISGRGQGAELGLQTAAVGLGQTFGAVSAGLLFEFNDIFGASLLVPGAMAIAAGMGLALPAQLAAHGSRSRERSTKVEPV
jgi:MFS family permease